jgi:hypothetical protein
MQAKTILHLVNVVPCYDFWNLVHGTANFSGALSESVIELAGRLAL